MKPWTEDEEREIMQAPKLWLYDSSGCPYCARVRGYLSEIGETVELRDVLTSNEHMSELIEATGSRMVPCLRIEGSDEGVRWLHESADIIDYLRNHFSGESAES